MSEPHEGNFEILKRAGRYLITRPRAACLYKWQSSSNNVCVCTDSDWAGDKKTRRPTTGGCMRHGSHIIKVWAKTQAAISVVGGSRVLRSCPWRCRGAGDAEPYEGFGNARE
eukprot:11775006-Heterocapsa_arctica.AAC.2